jgi:hypothetical protein
MKTAGNTVSAIVPRPPITANLLGVKWSQVEILSVVARGVV